MDAVFTQRFLLDKEMAEMCAQSPVYWIQKVKGTGSVKQSRDEGKKNIQASIYPANAQADSNTNVMTNVSIHMEFGNFLSLNFLIH